MRVVRKAMSACGTVTVAVLDRLLGYKPGASAAPWVEPSASDVHQFCPHREHMKQAKKLQKYYEEERRRRSWDLAPFGQTRS